MHISTIHKYFRILSILLIGSSVLQAQDQPQVEKLDPGPFYGFWEFQEPAGDTCVVIIKRGGRLSCFWAGTASRAIQKGTWERTDTHLTARWETGYVDVFTKLGDNAIERSSYEPGENLLENPFLTIRGVRVDSRIPGNLTVQRDEDSTQEDSGEEEILDPQRAPAIPMRNAFIGYWKIEQSTGIFGMGAAEPHFFLHLERSGSASVSLRDWEGDKAVRGRWTVENDRAVILWPNNRRDVLEPRPNTEGYTLATYKPKAREGSKPQDRSQAEKVQSTDAARYFDAGNFSRLTVEDIRGTWYPQDDSGNTEYISIEGWGNAYRYPAADGNPGSDPGKWRLRNDRIEITWVDGTKDLIRLTAGGFLQESFSANEPLTGTPIRSIPVIVRKDDPKRASLGTGE